MKTLLEEEILKENYKMCEPPEEGKQGEECEMVFPKVCIGNLPHGNFFTTYEMEKRYFKAPYILIGIEECTSDYEDETIPILIQACCYTQEAYKSEDNYFNIPDNMGILDVLNLLESMREWIFEDSRIPASKPVKIGSYNTKELTYPLAFGYLSFELETSEGKVNRSKLKYD